MSRTLSTLLACTLAFAAGACAMWARHEVQGVSRREPQLENEHVRVWKSIIMPKQPLTLHRHDHGRALIALTDGQLKVVDKDGKAIDTYDWKRGRRTGWASIRRDRCTPTSTTRINPLK